MLEPSETSLNAQGQTDPWSSMGRDGLRSGSDTERRGVELADGSVSARRSLRVLHVIGRLDRGGTENWLLNVARHASSVRMALSVATTRPGAGALDGRFAALGVETLRCAGHHGVLGFASAFLAQVRRHGPYDVVHSHVNDFSGIVLWLAARAGVPVRLAHSHSDRCMIYEASPPTRRLYFRLMRAMVRRYATGGLAASSEAASSLYGSAWLDDSRWRIHRCSLDLAQYQVLPDRRIVRTGIGVPSGSVLLIHVGRLVPAKNHAFLLHVAQEAIRCVPSVHLIVVGDGPLRAETERLARDLGIGDRVAFLGNRDDVPALLAASDVFALPSVYEGLPVSLLEAQATGLPYVRSTSVTGEVDAVPGLGHALDLGEPATRWADRLLRVAETGRTRDVSTAYTALAGSPFDVRVAVQLLRAEYGL